MEVVSCVRYPGSYQHMKATCFTSQLLTSILLKGRDFWMGYRDPGELFQVFSLHPVLKHGLSPPIEWRVTTTASSESCGAWEWGNVWQMLYKLKPLTITALLPTS